LTTFSEGASEQSLLTILSKAIFADLRQDCRKSTMLKIGFGNVAGPDFFRGLLTRLSEVHLGRDQIDSTAQTESKV
jgi:hypothetical protein